MRLRSRIKPDTLSCGDIRLPSYPSRRRLHLSLLDANDLALSIFSLYARWLLLLIVCHRQHWRSRSRLGQTDGEDRVGIFCLFAGKVAVRDGLFLLGRGVGFGNCCWRCCPPSWPFCFFFSAMFYDIAPFSFRHV